MTNLPDFTARVSPANNASVYSIKFNCPLGAIEYMDHYKYPDPKSMYSDYLFGQNWFKYNDAHHICELLHTFFAEHVPQYDRRNTNWMTTIVLHIKLPYESNNQIDKKTTNIINEKLKEFMDGVCFLYLVTAVNDGLETSHGST